MPNAATTLESFGSFPWGIAMPSPIAVSVAVGDRPRRFRAGSDPAMVGHSANLSWRRDADDLDARA